MPRKRHKTVGVKVGKIQVGGGAPVVVQSMTNTDTADVASTTQQCLELAQAGSELVRVTVNMPEAAAAVPGNQEAPARRRLRRSDHRRLPLQRPRPADEVSRLRPRARQIPHQSRQRRPRPAPRRAVRHHLQSRPRQRQARAHRRQRRLAQSGARHAQDAGEHGPRPRQDVRRDHQRVHGALGARIDRTRARVRLAQGSDHHLLQGFAARRSDRDLPRSRREDRSAAASRPHRSRHGRQGSRLVRRLDGNSARRRHRRHDPRFAHAAARRRPPRGSLRRVRVAAVARPAHLRAQRHRVPRLRPHHQHHVSGTRRKHSGLHPRQNAGMEAATTKASRN